MAEYLKASDFEKKFLSVPGQDLVQKLLLQLSRVKAMTTLFGPYRHLDEGKRATDQQRWADYQRQDWSVRQLPTINVFESTAENQTSDEGWLTGSIAVQVYWPPAFRRSDLARIPQMFKGILQNFLSSQYAAEMLDEHYSILRDCKVPGLNELGKTMTWTPNVEGIVENEQVPVTILDVGYRIDLRAWHRALEYQGRTKAEPFEVTLERLLSLDGGLTGVTGGDPTAVEIEVTERFKVRNS